MAVVESLNVVLSLTTGPFAKGTESAIKATKSLDDQLKLQIATFGKTTEEVTEYVLALKGVDKAAIDSIKASQQQLAALKEQESQRQAAIKAQAAAQAAALREQEAVRAAALKAQADAQAAAIKAQAQAEAQVQRIRDANRTRGEEITNSVRTAEERYAAEVRELNHLLKVGAINQQTFNRALDAAKTKLPQVQKQAVSLKGAFMTLRGLGVLPSLAGIAAGFNAARFTRESVGAFADSGQGRELKGTLDEFNQVVGQIKVNFGGWLSEAVGVRAAIQGINQAMKDISGVTTSERQAAVSGRGLPASNRTRDNVRANLDEAVRIRDSIARQLQRQSEEAIQGRTSFPAGSENLPEQLRVMNKEIALLESRLKTAPTGPQFEGLGAFATKELNKALPLFEAYKNEAESVFSTIKGGAQEAFGVWNSLQRKAILGFFFNQRRMPVQETVRPSVAEFGSQAAFEAISRRVSGNPQNNIPKLLADGLAAQKQTARATEDVASKVDDIERKIGIFLDRNDPKKPRL